MKNCDSQETITSFKEYDPVVQKGKNSSISNSGPATGQKKTPYRTGMNLWKHVNRNDQCCGGWGGWGKGEGCV